MKISKLKNYLKQQNFQDFTLDEFGTLHYKKAAHLQYEEDYFMKEYQAQYGKSYLADEPSLRKLAQKRLKYLTPYKNSHKNILEIGCAAGFFLDEAKKAGFVPRGLEISNFACEYAAGLGLHVTNESFLDVSFHETFDMVAAFYVIEHFPDQNLIFRKISSLLKPGGLFLFAMPSFHGPFFYHHPESFVKTHPADHFVDYSPRSLTSFLATYHFKKIMIKPSSFHPGRAGWPDSLSFIYKMYASFFCYGDTMEGLFVKVNSN